MDSAINTALAPWAQYGILGSVVIVLALVNVVQWRDRVALLKVIAGLHEARLADSKECTSKYVDMLTRNIETNNRMADGMEAFERIVDKVKA
jgi:hypothetical protein